jgi:hypothetical protein
MAPRGHREGAGTFRRRRGVFAYPGDSDGFTGPLLPFKSRIDEGVGRKLKNRNAAEFYPGNLLSQKYRFT